MATVTGIRTALATRLSTIANLRVESSVPDSPKPPTAIVIPQGIQFDSAMARGLDEYDFTILLIVHRMSERTAQASLDAFCDPTGASSIKACVVADPSLGGAVQFARITAMRNYGSISIGDVDYLSAEFAVQVYA
jgi:hypothetical protein